MSSTKKNKPVSEDQVNNKIQRQFNLVFDGDEKSKSPNENSAKDEDDGLNFDAQADEDMTIERGGNNKNTEVAATAISLDLASDSDTLENHKIPNDEAGTVIAKNDGLDFNLDFNLDGAGESTIIAPKSSSVATASKTEDKSEATLGGFVLDELDLAMNLSESTQKTVIVNFDKLKAGENGFSIEKTDSSINLLSNAEEQANIESTIKDILRPNVESENQSTNAQTTLSIASVGDDFELESNEDKTTIGSLQESGLDLNSAVSEEFSLEGFDSGPETTTKNNDTNFFNAGEDLLADSEDEDFSLLSEAIETPKSPVAPPTKSDFGDESLNFSDQYAEASDDIDPFAGAFTTESKNESKVDFNDSYGDSQSVDEAMDSLFSDEPPIVKSAPAMKVDRNPAPQSAGSDISQGSMNTEDSIRVQATIRSLREEREELLAKIKMFKTENKELEQDNLTIKANLDEAKIEITILRKRHMVELEDLKYRLTMSEEKKALAEEKARQADLRKEKLEQKVRIDFNQVKQREKELESKLELLSMDVDSQVQSRDHKILELRRKIDALEFNMENASIKEQKSFEDKRKLEDRLNKIMKTLRHSIKNLEDDIDHASDDNDHQKDKN